MNIAPLGSGDAQDAVALWHASGLTRPWNDPCADFVRAAAGVSSAVLGIRDAGHQLVGTVMVGDDGHRGWLYYLAVAPAHRHAGLGRRLVTAAERWLAARGVAKVQLMVRKGNATALSFYDALGYGPSDVTVLMRWLDGTWSENLGDDNGARARG